MRTKTKSDLYRAFCTSALALIVVVGVRESNVLPGILSVEHYAFREEAEQAIEDALTKANTSQRSAPQVKADRQIHASAMQETEKTILQIMKEKRDVRLQIAEKKETVDAFKEQYGVDPEDEEAMEQFYKKQRADVLSFIHTYLYLRTSNKERSQQLGYSMIASLAGASLSDRIEQDLRYQALNKARIGLMKKVDAVKELPSVLMALREQHDALLASYHASQGTFDDHYDQVKLSDAKLAEIRRIVAAVERQVRNLQLELSRYDEELRTEAEKELVKRGLLPPREGGYSAPEFIWPVVGEITAGFYEKSYQNYFGIPHKAIDIRQSQGSSVRSSADGIVYYVQNGGRYGYSYVLIGHRGGYGTLYGHLLQIHVSKGQRVAQGQVIGLSGGTPGTNGAGPMTTGAHLHFEVIQEGVHVNPTTVLP